MEYERCMCGASDCPICGPLQGYARSERDLELSLDEVVETILEHGQWPKKGRAQFDLYDYLLEERDPSYALEMFVASMSRNKYALENRRDRERKIVEALLIKHLKVSDLVSDWRKQKEDKP